MNLDAIKMTAILADYLESDYDDEVLWTHTTTPWRVTLTREGKRMTVRFYMGSGHEGKPPDLLNVLSCLTSDALAVLDNDYNGWCDELGFDTDSRKAHKLYKKCEKQTERLLNWLRGNSDDVQELYDAVREAEEAEYAARYPAKAS